MAHASVAAQALGVPALVALPPGEAGLRELLDRRWAQPSLSVVDLRPSLGLEGSLESTERAACYRWVW